MTTTTSDDQQTIQTAGAMELVRVPAWEAKYKIGEDPEEMAHFVCCRDLEWRRAFCGYVEENPNLIPDPQNVCTMCVETAESMGGDFQERQCPVDHRECPPIEEVQRMMHERASRA
jgi:hypothetical protein